MHLKCNTGVYIKGILLCIIFLGLFFSPGLTKQTGKEKKFTRLHIYYLPIYHPKFAPVSDEQLTNFAINEVFIENEKIIEKFSDLVNEFSMKHEKHMGTRPGAVLQIDFVRVGGQRGRLNIDEEGQFRLDRTEGKMSENQLKKMIEIIEGVINISDMQYLEKKLSKDNK